MSVITTAFLLHDLSNKVVRFYVMEIRVSNNITRYIISPYTSIIKGQKTYKKRVIK